MRLHLPSAENGYGLLKVGPRDLGAVQMLLCIRAFVAPKQKVSARTPVVSVSPDPAR